jgi:hypothetical protein
VEEVRLYQKVSSPHCPSLIGYNVFQTEAPAINRSVFPQNSFAERVKIVAVKQNVLNCLALGPAELTGWGFRGLDGVKVVVEPDLTYPKLADE